MDLNKLVKRSMTALVFAAIVLFLIFWNDLSLHAFTWIISFLCCFEYLSIRYKGKQQKMVLILLSLLVGAIFPILSFLGWFTFYPIMPLLLLAVFYNLYLGGRIFFNYAYASSFLNILFTAFLYIGFPILLLSQFMHNHNGQHIILNILIIIWASDSFAYLLGSSMGKKKIMPKVSPGKTWEGTIGGGIFAIVASLVMYYFFPLGSMFFHVFLGLIIWFFGFIGDLVESHLKRDAEIKDSGKLLPGHGGFLDRFDSFIYLLPFVLLYLELFL